MRKNHPVYLAFALLLVGSILLGACAPAATPVPTEVATEVVAPTDVPVEPTAVPTEEPTEVVTEEAAPEIGSAEHPIKVLFVPSVDANVIVSGGEIMADALKEATGLEYEVSVPTSYAATIEEMCASPADTMAFIPAQGYVIANQLCGVDVAFKAVRRGWGVYWTQFIVQRDSDIQTLEDLNGKTWAYPDAGSTSGFLFPSAMFKEEGITPGDTLEAGGHPQVVRAIYNGEADFGTTYFSAPAKPEGEEPWKEGDNPDIPDELLDECGVSEDDKLMCGEWEVLDARATMRTEAPDVVQKVRILTLTDPIPNDTLSFGPDFDPALRQEISDALVAFSQTEAWSQSIGMEDFYGWTGIQPATDAEYDPIRLLVEFAGVTIESLK